MPPPVVAPNDDLIGSHCVWGKLTAGKELLKASPGYLAEGLAHGIIQIPHDLGYTSECPRFGSFGLQVVDIGR